MLSGKSRRARSLSSSGAGSPSISPSTLWRRVLSRSAQQSRTSGAASPVRSSPSRRPIKMSHKDALLSCIAARTARVGVIGLGYVGLPLALLFEEAGLGVLGFDVDPTKPDALHRGESYIRHIGTERVAAAF